jgi:hypothetical protein
MGKLALIKKTSIIKKVSKALALDVTHFRVRRIITL